MVTLQDMFDEAHFREATMTPVSQPLAVACESVLVQQEQPARKRSETLLSWCGFVQDAGRDACRSVCSSRKTFFFKVVLC